MEGILLVSSGLLWLVVSINVLLTLGVMRRLRSESRQTDGLRAGTRAPDFAAETLQGRPASLADYAGRTVSFLFISTKCSPCRAALPSYKAIAAHASRAGVALVLVSLDDMSATRSFVDELSIDLPVLVAPTASTQFAQDYKVSATPSYCLVDARGRVKSSGFPGSDHGEWKALVESWTSSQGGVPSPILAEGGD